MICSVKRIKSIDPIIVIEIAFLVIMAFLYCAGVLATEERSPVPPQNSCETGRAEAAVIETRAYNLRSLLDQQVQNSSTSKEKLYNRSALSCFESLATAARCCGGASLENCVPISGATSRLTYNPFSFAINKIRSRSHGSYKYEVFTKVKMSSSGLEQKNSLANQVNDLLEVAETQTFSCAETRSACLQACDALLAKGPLEKAIVKSAEDCLRGLALVYLCHKENSESLRNQLAEYREALKTDSNDNPDSLSMRCSKTFGRFTSIDALADRSNKNAANSRLLNSLTSCELGSQASGNSIDLKSALSKIKVNRGPAQSQNQIKYADKIAANLRNSPRNTCWRGTWETLKAAGCVKGELKYDSAKDSWKHLKTQGFYHDLKFCDTPGVVRVYDGAPPGMPKRTPGDIHGHVEIMLPNGHYQHYRMSQSTRPINKVLGNDRRRLTHCMVKPKC